MNTIQRPARARSSLKKGLVQLRVPLLVSTALAVIDVYIWIPGPGLLACLVLAIIGFVLALGFRRQQDARAEATFSGACVYAIAVLIMLGVFRYQEEHAKLNAAVLIVATEAYHHQKGRWPKDLDALVPRYMAKVPAVTFRPGHRFSYRADKSAVLLSWAGVWPGSRWSYEFLLGESAREKALSAGLPASLRPHWLGGAAE